MKRTGLYPRVRTGFGSSAVVCQAGGMLLAETIRRTGLDTALSAVDSVAARRKGFLMALLFQIDLLTSRGESHFYRAVIDGGDRTLFLLLDETAQKIRLANSEGNPEGGTAMLIDSGNVIGGSTDEPTPDFSLTAAHLRSSLIKAGAVPTRIRKFFG